MNLINLIKEEYNKFIKESKQDLTDKLLDRINDNNKLNYLESKLLKLLSKSDNLYSYNDIISKFLDTLKLEHHEEKIKSFGKEINTEYLLDLSTTDVNPVFSLEENKNTVYILNTYYNQLFNIFKDFIDENTFDNILVNWGKKNLNNRINNISLTFDDEVNLNESFQDDDIEISDDQIKSDIQHYTDLLDNLDKNNPRREYYINKLKDIYNYEYKDPHTNYDIEDIVKQITNRKYVTKTNKGFEFTFITRKNKTLNNIVQIEIFDNHYNNIGHVGFTIDTEDKSIVIGGAKVFDNYKRKGIYSAVVDFIQQVADKFNIKIKEGSRSSDAREFWQDRKFNNKKIIKYNI
jgi:hypothetical protein